jgi:hypothetical protein
LTSSKYQLILPIRNVVVFSSITMFADYRVPQVLYHFGILNYDDVLIQHLRALKPMKKNSEMEIAIRGLSIYACEVCYKWHISTFVFLENNRRN